MTRQSVTRQWSRYLADEAATVNEGQRLGELLEGGIVIYLEGTLGAGKTTFCRGVMRAFHYSGPVKSPTYTLVEPYFLDGGTVYHFDLYRLGCAEELEFMGIRDYFQTESVCLVEWPAKGEGFLPAADLIVKVAPEGTGRRLTVTSNSTRGEAVLAKRTAQEQQQQQETRE